MNQKSLFLTLNIFLLLYEWFLHFTSSQFRKLKYSYIYLYILNRHIIANFVNFNYSYSSIYKQMGAISFLLGLLKLS